MTDQPTDPALVIVHFDWDWDTIEPGDGPKCPAKPKKGKRGGGPTTISLRTVTCPECLGFIEQMVGAWCRPVPPEPA